VLRAVRESGSTLTAASFGVAGPVRDGRVQATNLPWTIDGAEVARKLGLERVGLINDLEANAWGLETLAPADLLVLQAGADDARGNRALIAAGTGLGQAGLVFDGTRHLPFACEGGHSSFAPRDELEDGLLVFLRAKFGHVSWERVLSGPGLHNVYQFLRETQRGLEPDWLGEQIRAGDPAAAISQAATSGRSELAEMALSLFVDLYGSEAGNLALKTLSTGGIYLGGGIAPRIRTWLARPAFLEAFLSKGRMRALLETVPVRLVLNDQTALLGAARHAAGR
jgi:glucokinase